MKRLGIALLVVVLALGAVVVVRAVRFSPLPNETAPLAPLELVPGAAERLAGAIRIPTVSPEDSSDRDSTAFRTFHTYLEQSFPRVHATMRRETIGLDALLYTWMGSDTTLAPLVLMGHMDVVPVAPGTDTAWTHPPFSGAIAEGFVWGRGSLDDKGTVLGVLEASEMLLARGFQPKRTVLLAFGADEERGGEQGAKRIATLLQRRGVKPMMVLDEGGTVITGAIPGVAEPVALVGIAEKGYLNVELSVRAEGGHSSMPPNNTAAGILARAITRVENNPLPATIRGGTAALFDAVGREMSFGMRAVFANRWLFDPVIERRLAARPATNATIRTTTAVTMLEGSPKANVLPHRARAIVNFRILPGESIASVLEHVRSTIDDSRVEADVSGVASEPSPLSPINDSTWARLTAVIRQAYPDVVVAPYLVVGGTDARHFRDLTPNVYRFSGARIVSEDLRRVHGTNERLSIAAYEEGIRFLAQLVRSMAGG
ncbi:MAG TPA: M20 family peptidase [Gemmatimonadaceae bacterium]|nr:M20 family peptidase [Gemmatimonadaceae bacterium]